MLNLLTNQTCHQITRKIANKERKCMHRMKKDQHKSHFEEKKTITTTKSVKNYRTIFTIEQNEKISSHKIEM